MAILVKDVMIEKVIQCTKVTTIRQAAELMKKAKIGSVVVVEGKRPVGIVTREDIIDKAVAEGVDPSNAAVKEIMSAPLITCSPDDELSVAARKMNKHGFERIPVKYLDKLIGIITIRQILKISPELLDLLKEKLEEMPSFLEEEEKTEGECEICGNYSDDLHFIDDQWICDNCGEEVS